MEIKKIYDEIYGMIEDLKRKVAGIKPGDAVTITPALDDGTKIADYTIGETEGSLFAPTPPAPYTPLNFSTTAQDTGVKWADGRSLYVQSFYGTLSGNASNLKIGEIADFEEAVFIIGTVAGGGVSLQTPWNSGLNNADQAYCRVDEATGNVQLTHSFAQDYPNYRFTIWFLQPAPSPEPENNTKKRRK